MRILSRFFKFGSIGSNTDNLTLIPEYPRLHMACGNNILPQWINTDLSPQDGASLMDFTKPFPYSDACFDAVFCEHSIEHISKDEAQFMCGEVYRVLRDGGRFRVVTPSLEKMAKMALSENSEETKYYLNWYRKWNKEPDASVSDAVNAMFYKHGHRHLYLKSELSNLLFSVGFKALEFYETNEYGDVVFNSVDGHGRVIGEEINAAEAIAVEAMKAGTGLWRS